MNTTTELSPLQLANAIIAAGLLADAERQIQEADLAGLAYIVNMVEGRPGNSGVKMGRLFALSEELSVRIP